MMEARILGNYVQHLAEREGLSIHDLSELLGCSEHQVNCFFKGRAFLSYPQILSLAQTFNTTVDMLLKGDKEEYDLTVVHCMNDFKDSNQREKILNIIDGYIDIVDALN